jgi:hypothetical protein
MGKNTWATGPEPDRPCTGALDQAAAFQKHYTAIFGTGGKTEPEDYAGMRGVELLLALSRIDRRHLAELPNTIIGRPSRGGPRERALCRLCASPPRPGATGRIS